jgi:hypothetical protein
LHRHIENEEVSAYCDANADISHVAPRGTESDANYLATTFPHGWARRNKQGHTKGVEFLLGELKKILIQLFMKGEETKGEKRSAALMLAHLISIAHATICNRYAVQTTTQSEFGTSGNGWQPLRS